MDRNGRPAVVVQATLNVRGAWVHEFSSLATGPFIFQTVPVSSELSCPSVRFNARVGTGTEDACLWINGDGRVRT